MIDLENKVVKDGIKLVKYKIEKKILESFKVKVLPMFCGELHEGFYKFIISYEFNDELIRKRKKRIFKRKLNTPYFAGKGQISEEDYNKELNLSE